MSLEGLPAGGDRSGNGRRVLHPIGGHGDLYARREAVHSVLSLQNQAADSSELGYFDPYSSLRTVNRTDAHQGLLRFVYSF